MTIVDIQQQGHGQKFFWLTGGIHTFTTERETTILTKDFLKQV